jgi:hypothetical protein
VEKAAAHCVFAGFQADCNKETEAGRLIAEAVNRETVRGAARAMDLIESILKAGDKMIEDGGWLKKSCVDGLMQEQKLSRNGFELFFLAQGSEPAHFTRLRSTLSCLGDSKFTKGGDETVGKESKRFESLCTEIA